MHVVTVIIIAQCRLLSDDNLEKQSFVVLYVLKFSFPIICCSCSKGSYMYKLIVLPREKVCACVVQKLHESSSTSNDLSIWRLIYSNLYLLFLLIYGGSTWTNFGCTPPPPFLNLRAVFKKFGQIIVLTPLRWVGVQLWDVLDPPLHSSGIN